MEFRALELDGLLEIRPRKLVDERGYFSEIFRQSDFAERAGPVQFVQENQSLSTRAGTVRGIHFQTEPAAQGKLVRCLGGRLFDVAVDLRRDSPTYGRWSSVILSAEENNQLWIPAGFGHAFCTLEADSVASYWLTSYYSAANDKGVTWDDPEIAIDWPEIARPDTLSAKDRQQPRLRDLPGYFTMATGR